MIRTDEVNVEDLVSRTRSGGGTGFATSDELLEHGRGGLRFFERFLPRYEAWTGRTLGGGMAGITATYDEVSGIRFDRLRADADRLAQVHGDLTDRNDQLTGNVSALRGMWEGDAATEADDYGSGFLRDAATVADGVDVAQTLISMSADRAETAVMTRAQLVSGLDSHHVGGLTPRQVDQVINAARGNAGPVQLFEMVMLAAFAPADGVPAFTEEQSFTGMLDQAAAWMGQRGKQWLDEVFVPSVEASYQAFQQYTSITTQDVGDSWTGMNDGVGALDPQQPDQTAPAGVPSSAQSPARPPVSTTPDDSATGFPGSTSPGGAVPAPVEDQPPVQVTTPASTLPPSTSDTASPIGSTLTNSGAPAAAGDPQLAEAPDMGGDQVGRIGDGLTLSKPDAGGRAQLTVQHPDGSVVQYPVDLGAMNSGSAGQGVSGADGTATIHDGSTTITLHRPSSGGPITVTVDDGTGAPQSYTVDFGDDAPSGAGDPALASNQPDLLQHHSSGGGASMAHGGSGAVGNTAADGSAGAGLGHLGGAGSTPSPAAPKPQPGSYSGVGETSQLPAAAAAGAAGVVGARAATGGGFGGGMMPMMGGMGGGRGGDHERQGGRYNASEDFFGEDTSSYAKIKNLLEPELPE
ncbi:WXG100 family type VII secretion target [Labedaea rhizosphaerae]|uniref:Type VII secretion system (Wss) protein ESAT-6 n=1 Tax=Labedaea rhizosphaerae TaxID=598644 RepID=A0A4R6SQB0_LABRH|nr:WXG100 family type VII secretion target [Labedaea rhizosphaerae]TDQ05790.1 type VII secretion system (Wss) protein ESAT-6 [Labedaea rhizosphaerae]